jgi:hypothetical protein
MDEIAPGGWVCGCNRSHCPNRNDSSCLLFGPGFGEFQPSRSRLAHQRRLAGKLSRVSAREQAARVS